MSFYSKKLISQPHLISYIYKLFDKGEQIVRQHRLEDPDLYRMVEEKKIILLKEANKTKTVTASMVRSQGVEKVRVTQPVESIYFKQTKQNQLKVRY